MKLIFRIQLRGITKPPVWRKMEIPGNFTFDDFHKAIQTAFGWENRHLYQFQRNPYDGGWTIVVPNKEAELGYGPEDIDARATLVGDFIKENGLKKFVYVYDFGDDWIHDITLLEMDESTVQHLPYCLEGKGACPPEDCGGMPGYEHMKQLLGTSPKSQEAQMFMRWMGMDNLNDFDPDYFDRGEANLELTAITPSKPIKKSKNDGRAEIIEMHPQPTLYLHDYVNQILGGIDKSVSSLLDNIMGGDNYDNLMAQDFEGIYCKGEQSRRCEVKVERNGKMCVLQVPSILSLTGFAQLLMKIFGYDEEYYEFLDFEEYPFMSAKEYEKRDKNWPADPTDYSAITNLLWEIEYPAHFKIKKNGRTAASFHLSLRKIGRYTDKTIAQPIKLLRSKQIDATATEQVIQQFAADNPLPSPGGSR